MSESDGFDVDGKPSGAPRMVTRSRTYTVANLHSGKVRLVELIELTEFSTYLSIFHTCHTCLLYTSPSPRDLSTSRMPSSA